MKKAIQYGFIVSVLLLSLSACSKEQAQEMPTEEPQIETAVPEAPSQEPQAETITTAAPEQDELEQALSGEELIAEFQKAYNYWNGPEMGTGNNIILELATLKSNASIDGFILPEDYEEQYREWRLTKTAIEKTQTQAKDFTEVNEVVYATSTVNIRSEASADSNKVGSLSKGQSVTRTGIGTGEFTGWSKVQLSDGSTAYISSQYLSTTKPVQSNSSSGSNSGSGGSGGGSSDSNTNDPDIGSTFDFKVTDPSELETGMTEEQKQWEKEHIKIEY